MTRLLRRMLSTLGRERDVPVERAIADAQARAELAACRARRHYNSSSVGRPAGAMCGWGEKQKEQPDARCSKGAQLRA